MKKSKNHNNNIQTIIGLRFVIDNYDVITLEKINEDAYSSVYTCVDKTGTIHILRIIQTADRDILVAAMSSIVLHSKLSQHYNILRIEGYVTLERSIQVLFEFCDSSLISEMEKVLDKGFTRDKIVDIFSSIVAAVRFIHSQETPIIHRGINPRNILCSKGVWKLCNFRCSTTKVYNTDNEKDRQLATDDISRNTNPSYRAPEMVDLYRGEIIDTKSDIWSLGCLLFRLCTLKDAFPDGKSLQILNGKFQWTQPWPVDEYFKNIVARCLNPNPKDRPTAAELDDEIRAHFQLKPTPPPSEKVVKMTDYQSENHENCEVHETHSNHSSHPNHDYHNNNHSSHVNQISNSNPMNTYSARMNIPQYGGIIYPNRPSQPRHAHAHHVQLEYNSYTRALLRIPPPDDEPESDESDIEVIEENKIRNENEVNINNEKFDMEMSEIDLEEEEEEPQIQDEQQPKKRTRRPSVVELTTTIENLIEFGDEPTALIKNTVNQFDVLDANDENNIDEDKNTLISFTNDDVFNHDQNNNDTNLSSAFNTANSINDDIFGSLTNNANKSGNNSNTDIFNSAKDSNKNDNIFSSMNSNNNPFNSMSKPSTNNSDTNTTTNNIFNSTNSNNKNDDVFSSINNSSNTTNNNNNPFNSMSKPSTNNSDTNTTTNNIFNSTNSNNKNDDVFSSINNSSSTANNNNNPFNSMSKSNTNNSDTNTTNSNPFNSMNKPNNDDIFGLMSNTNSVSTSNNNAINTNSNSNVFNSLTNTNTFNNSSSSSNANMFSSNEQIFAAFDNYNKTKNIKNDLLGLNDMNNNSSFNNSASNQQIGMANKASFSTGNINKMDKPNSMLDSSDSIDDLFKSHTKTDTTDYKQMYQTNPNQLKTTLLKLDNLSLSTALYRFMSTDDTSYFILSLARDSGINGTRILSHIPALPSSPMNDYLERRKEFSINFPMFEGNFSLHVFTQNNKGKAPPTPGTPPVSVDVAKHLIKDLEQFLKAFADNQKALVLAEDGYDAFQTLSYIIAKLRFFNIQKGFVNSSTIPLYNNLHRRILDAFNRAQLNINFPPQPFNFDDEMIIKKLRAPKHRDLYEQL